MVIGNFSDYIFSMDATTLRKKILATVIYYDIIDYPLTSFEVWKYLLARNKEQETRNNAEEEIVIPELSSDIKLVDIIKELDNSEVRKFVGEFQGYYFLKGRESLVRQRIERNKISVAKMKIIRRVVRFLRFVPFVRMIAVTGRVAMKNAERKSDLDLLIVLEKNHIFIGRTLVTILTHILGKRRYGNKVTNRICLNYFITTDSLEIALKDRFAVSEYSFIFPLFNFSVFQKFQENNFWISNFRENYSLDSIGNIKMIKDSFLSRWVREIGEKILGSEMIEKKLAQWETDRIAKDPRTHQDGSIIIADEDMLVFLPEPQGPGVTERFENRMKKISM